MMIIFYPLVVLIFGLIVWIVSAKAVDWPSIGKILFTIGAFFTVAALAKQVFRL